MLPEEHPLYHHPFFQGLPAEHLDVVMRIVRTINFPDRAPLFLQGDQARSVYFIVEGRLVLKATLPGGGEVELTSLQAGDILGELALMKHHRRSVGAFAEGRLTALCMDSEDLSALCAHYHPASLLIMHRLAKTVARRIQDSNQGAAHVIDDEWCKLAERESEETVNGAEFHFQSFLPALSFFKHFSKADIEALVAMGHEITVPKHCLVRRPYDENRNCYVIIRGALETCFVGAEGSYRTEVLGPGGVLGETGWLLNEAPASAARSLSRSTLLVLPASCRETLNDAGSHLSFRFHESLVRSLLSKLDTQARGYARRQQVKLIGAHSLTRESDRV
ncbi:MAG: cyclic nucleotide-binding domain-containing protein [Gammaproteobacteria bacterium]